MEKALILDLDGTLADTVYAHVFAWQRALGRRSRTAPEAGAWIDSRVGLPRSGAALRSFLPPPGSREDSSDWLDPPPVPADVVYAAAGARRPRATARAARGSAARGGSGRG